MIHKEKISIITPVYNRVKELIRLYNSLCNQTNSNFIWIIVDDGSKESINLLIDRWKKQAKFKITLIVQSNQGKMHAYKHAVQHLSTPWSLVVDSDDTVSKEMISILYKNIDSVSRKDECGMVFPRQLGVDSDEILLWKKLPSKINIIALRYQYNIQESAILIKTDYLKKAFCSLQLPNETFISEEILYNELMTQGSFTVKTNLFYFGEYQDDGLTNHLFKLWLDNPESTILLFQSRYKALSTLNFKEKMIGKFKTILNLNAFCLKRKLSIRSVTPNLGLSILLYFPSVILKKIRFR